MLEIKNPEKFELFSSQPSIQEIHNHKNDVFECGSGFLYYPELIRHLELKIDSKGKTDLEEGQVININRIEKDTLLWYPFLLKYQISESKHPFKIKVENNKVLIVSQQKSALPVSGEIRIEYENSGHPPHFQLFPRNLTHKTKHLGDKTLLWMIERIQNGNKYSIEFKTNHDSFKIFSINCKFAVKEIISSGLEVEFKAKNGGKSVNKETITIINIKL